MAHYGKLADEAKGSEEMYKQRPIGKGPFDIGNKVVEWSTQLSVRMQLGANTMILRSWLIQSALLWEINRRHASYIGK